jgi:hypothetical protein
MLVGDVRLDSRCRARAGALARRGLQVATADRVETGVATVTVSVTFFVDVLVVRVEADLIQSYGSGAIGVVIPAGRRLRSLPGDEVLTFPIHIHLARRHGTRADRGVIHHWLAGPPPSRTSRWAASAATWLAELAAEAPTTRQPRLPWPTRHNGLPRPSQVAANDQSSRHGRRRPCRSPARMPGPMPATSARPILTSARLPVTRPRRTSQGPRSRSLVARSATNGSPRRSHFP